MAYVLLVDDEPTILEALTIVLGTYGVKWKTASAGLEALALVREEVPALALIDFQMPGMGGEEVISRCRAMGAEMPTILMSAQVRGLDQRAAALGCVGWLPKPFAVAAVHAFVDRFVPSAAGGGLFESPAPSCPPGPVRAAATRRSIQQLQELPPPGGCTG
jgi:CheY-like chemotaxis protein